MKILSMQISRYSRKAFSLILTFGFIGGIGGISSAAIGASKESLLRSKFTKACVKRMADADSKQNRLEVCECIFTNLSPKARGNELEKIIRVYEGANQDGQVIDDDSGDLLLDFEMEISEKCLANPKWRLSKPAKKK